MKPTGTTYIAYDTQRPDLLERLHQMGITSQRAISHNQSSYFVDGVFYSHEFMDRVKELPFPTIFDTLNDFALPILSWQEHTGRYTQDTFLPWLCNYVPHMRAQEVKNYNLVMGNEPDSGHSIYSDDWASFLTRYAQVEMAVRATGLKIGLGMGGYCQDWERAADDAAWCQRAGIRVDFIDAHIYGDPNQLRKLYELLQQKAPGVGIVVLESGEDWREIPPQQSIAGTAEEAVRHRAWYDEMARAVEECNVSHWHIHYGWASDENRALSLMGPDGGLTTLGRAVVGDESS